MSEGSPSAAQLRSARVSSLGETYSLVVHIPEHDPLTFSLEAGRVYTIGRRPSSDIHLDYPWVSTDHAILCTDRPPQLMDVGSRNGTSYRQTTLVPGTRYALDARDEFSIGCIRLELKSVPAKRHDLDAANRKNSQTLPPPTGDSERVISDEADPYVVRDQKMKELYAFVKRVAKSRVSVLILGETGVGKEVMARSIHQNSPRRDRLLIGVNCPAIPEALVESELFGYERGAFSGAVNAKPGMFEAAHQSTLFLDEVGDLPRTVQAKLLRVLETGEVWRLGAVRPRKVDVRIVAATNRDLQCEISAGNFRADLFYRLSGITLQVPPLRERPDDIVALAEFFIRQAAQSASPPLLSAGAEALIRDHVWVGNVRELRSVVERAMLLAENGVVEPEHLNFEAARPSQRVHTVRDFTPPSGVRLSSDFETFTEREEPTGAVAAKFREELARREAQHIQDALKRTSGNQKAAAQLLGISRRTLINRLERHGIPRPRKGRRLSNELSASNDTAENTEPAAALHDPEFAEKTRRT